MSVDREGAGAIVIEPSLDAEIRAYRIAERASLELGALQEDAREMAWLLRRCLAEADFHDAEELKRLLTAWTDAHKDEYEPQDEALGDLSDEAGATGARGAASSLSSPREDV